MQKFITLLAGILFSTLMIAQQPSADTSYRLLWYKGKKLMPNVLLTMKKDTVRYDRIKSIVKVTHAKGNGQQLDLMLEEFNKTPQRMNETAKRMLAGMPKTLAPAYINVMQDAYSSVQKEFGPCLSNTLEIPSVPFSKEVQTARGPFVSYELFDQTFEEAVQEVMNFYEQHKSEKITFVPTPPRREFTYCTMDDEGVEVRYERDFEVFRKELMGKDEAIFQLILRLSRCAELLMDENTRLQVNNQLIPVTNMLLQRLYDRSVLLNKQFSDDPHRCWSLFKILLMIERQLALLGWFDEHNSSSVLADFLENAMRTWASMYEKAMQEYDYTVTLNINAILGIERISQLHDLKTRMPVNKILAFNRFKLNMHVSAKIAAEGGYQLCELEGDNWFSALPDTAGKLQWILVGPLVNKITMNLKAAEFRGKIDFPYIGSRKWESQLPKIKMDFCNEGDDSLDVYMFYVNDHKETWVFPKPQGPINILIVSGILQGTFMDVERIRETQQKFKQDPAMIEKMKKDALARLEKLKQYGGFPKDIPNDGSYEVTLPRMGSINDMQRQINDWMNKSKEYDPTKFEFKPHPHNRDRMILEEKLNGKELFPQNSATEYAWFHLKLEQDPNCPYTVQL
ncbi:MAG TPA: hypothetical protein VHM26_09430 [Chitinophagaceae bacterium]|jgi:hypothetical protein|nr:hypothetical protein [Chitinophagaceae bacterium]